MGWVAAFVVWFIFAANSCNEKRKRRNRTKTKKIHVGGGGLSATRISPIKGAKARKGFNWNPATAGAISFLEF